MNAYYEDIRKRIPQEPLWHDDNGVPRYDPFHPDLCPNIYAKVVVLFRIACQACETKFDVEAHSSWFSPIRCPKDLTYGDAPKHDHPDGRGRCSGETMTSDIIAVLEVWRKGGDHEWERVPEQEGVYTCEGQWIAGGKAACDAFKS